MPRIWKIGYNRNLANKNHSLINILFSEGSSKYIWYSNLYDEWIKESELIKFSCFVMLHAILVIFKYINYNRNT